MPEKTLSEVFGDIADAIREKTESQETMTPLEMADEISSILKPSGTITISESGSYNVTEYAEANVEVAGFEPEDSGWYYYDTQSKWYDQPSIPANTLVYATERGDECVYPALNSGSNYTYLGSGQFETYSAPTETLTIDLSSEFYTDAQDIRDYATLYLDVDYLFDYGSSNTLLSGYRGYDYGRHHVQFSQLSLSPGLYSYDESNHELNRSSIEPGKTYSFDNSYYPTEVTGGKGTLYAYGAYGATQVFPYNKDTAFVIEYGGPDSENGDGVGELDLSDLQPGESRIVTVPGWDHKYQITRLPDE